jgi:hypothetical protein
MITTEFKQCEVCGCSVVAIIDTENATNVNNEETLCADCISDLTEHKRELSIRELVAECMNG